MSAIEQLTAGSTVCDPACGVGGFILEPLINKRPTDFRGGDTLTYLGLDRDPKTIILAKANMLIHLSEVLEDDPDGAVPPLAEALSDTFKSMARHISGALAAAPTEVYDLVLSNPPYVVSGTTQQKQMLAAVASLADYYDTSSMGVEGLFMQLIVKGLKGRGRAFVVVPDGMLFRHGDKPLRKFILTHCEVEAIISLPKDTFYTTPKKTYILGLRKKADHRQPQQKPVFTYLASAVGETLDAKRFSIDDNDLPDMAQQFQLFAGNPSAYSPPHDNERCRVHQIGRLRDCESWIIEHWWDGDELEALGLVDAQTSATPQQFIERLSKLRGDIGEVEEALASLAEPASGSGTRSLWLSDSSVFTLSIGRRVTAKQLREDIADGQVPLFSANVREPFAEVDPATLPPGCFVNDSFQAGSVLWAIDGDWDVVPTAPGESFATTDHCGRIQLEDPDLDPGYIAAAIYRSGAGKFTREYRPSLQRMRKLEVKVPLNADDEFDLTTQRALAARFHAVEQARRTIEQLALETLDVVPEPLAN